MTGLLCKNPRIVLILGTGYLGKALAESLRKAGHTALTADIDPQKAIYEADVADQASMQGLAARIPSSGAPARGEAERKPTATFTLMERGTRWKPFPERRSSSVPAQPSMESRTDAGLRRNTTSIPPPEKTGCLFRRNRRFWQRGARSSGWEPCTGRAAVLSPPSTSRRGRPSITSTGTMPQPPCTCSAPCGNRLPAFTT